MITANEAKENVRKTRIKQIPLIERLFNEIRKEYLRFKFEKDIVKYSKQGCCGIHIPSEINDDRYRTELKIYGFEVINESIYKDESKLSSWYCYWHENHGDKGTWTKFDPIYRKVENT